MAIDEYGPFRRRMQALWARDLTLWGGTEAMREAQTVYLPRFENESDKNYSRRLSLASLTNFYTKTANSMVGQIFRDPVEVTDSSLPKDMLDNIDNRGRSVADIAEKCAEHLLRKAVAVIVVDYPKVEGVLTLAQERERGLRHYWTCIPPENVIDVRSAFVDGREVIVHIRWFEDGVRQGEGEFDFDIERQVCVLDRPLTQSETGETIIGAPRGRRYRQEIEQQSITKTETHFNAYAVKPGGNYIPVTDWIPLRAPELPVVVMQVNRTALFEGKPPLADIAEKNIQHWRQSSNYGNSLEIGAYPILARFGANRSAPLTPLDDDLKRSDEGEVLVGPHIIMNLPSTIEGSDLRYVEPTGAAYEALERALDRIIAEAEMMALDLLVKTGQRTATETNIDRLEQLAPLQRVANEIEYGINRALELTAAMRGAGERAGFIEINKDFGVSTSDGLRVQALRDARALGDLTPETYLNELKAIGALSQSVNVETEVENADAGLTNEGRLLARNGNGGFGANRGDSSLAGAGRQAGNAARRN